MRRAFAKLASAAAVLSLPRSDRTADKSPAVLLPAAEIGKRGAPAPIPN
jgi:hypothetical protein